MEDYLSIGFTKKTHGIGGELKVQIEEKYLEDFLKAQVVFLLLKGKKVPYFIENARSGNILLVKFEEVDSKEAANELVSKEIFLSEAKVLSSEERELEIETDELFYEKYVGYKVEDLTLGKIGEIHEVREFPQQEMAVIFYMEKEILIPLHANLIEQIDELRKSIVMDLPSGLLEL